MLHRPTARLEGTEKHEALKPSILVSLSIIETYEILGEMTQSMGLPLLLEDTC